MLDCAVFADTLWELPAHTPVTSPLGYRTASSASPSVVDCRRAHVAIAICPKGHDGEGAGLQRGPTWTLRARDPNRLRTSIFNWKLWALNLVWSGNMAFLQ